MKFGASTLAIAIILVAALGVIAFEPRGALAQSAPSFTLSWDSPSSATVGESFNIEARIHNVSGTGERGGITFSFPSLTGGGVRSNRYESSAADISEVRSNGMDVAFYAEGSSINHSNGRRISASHLLVESDGSGWSSRSDRTLRLRVTPKRAGRFEFRVRGWLCADGYQNCARSPYPGARHEDGRDQQGWSVGVRSVNVAAATPADDHGDSRASATAMNVDSTVRGNIGTSEDEDFFSFRAQSGAEYTIETRVRSGLDTVIELHSGRGARLRDDDDDGPGRGSKIVWSAPSSGTYYVKVYGYDGSEGGYSLSLSERVPPTPAPAQSPPSFGLAWDYPDDPVTVGESFNIEARIYSVSGTGERGGISFSFPSLTGGGVRSNRYESSAADISEVQSNGMDVAFYAEGSSINHADGQRINASHLLVESEGSGWSSSSDRTLRLRVTPKRAGRFEFRVRGWLCADGYQICAYQPAPGARRDDGRDQQGRSVVIRGVNVEAAPAPATPSGSGRIAFKSERDGNAEIYAMNADGSGLTRITNNSAHDRLPDWSPDGRKIAFASNRGGDVEIYVMNADGSNVTRITNTSGGESWSPSWSPDGRRIAFVSNRNGNENIYVMNADGSNETRVTNSSMFKGKPSWSRDGRRLTFDSYPRGRIYVVNVDGSGLTTIRTSASWNPAFSPANNSLIAFGSGSGGIYTMNADGSNVARLTSHGGGAAWSPDGRSISFTSRRDGNNNIYSVDADGSNVARLTSHSANDEHSSWGAAPERDGSVAPPPAPADDHGDSRASATAMNVDSTVRGNIGTSDDEDFFSFQAREGAEYTIETSVRSGLDTVIALYSGQGTRLALDDDSGSGSASKITWTAPSSGTYYVRVYSYDGESVGGYDLSLSERVQTRTPEPIIVEHAGYFPALPAGSVTVGESFDIKIELANGGGDGERGGISVSFPTLTGGSKSSNGWTSSLADVRVVDYTSGTRNVSIYKTGDSLNHANGSRMSARHLLIESDDATWREGANRALTLRVTPKRAGDFPIMYRVWICADGYSDCERSTSRGTEDQQGYMAYRGVVEVAAAAADDHGDDRSSATRVSISNSGISLVMGNIETPGDEDFFSFQAQGGAEYTIRTHIVAASDVDTVIALYSGRGAQLAQNDDGGEGFASKLEWTAPSSGTYYVNVYGHGASVGAYDLSWSESVPEAAPTPAPVPNISRFSVPNAATAGRGFDIEITLANDGGNGERGGVSVSFPTLTGGSKSSDGWTSSLADVRVVEYTSGTGNVSIHKTGDSLNRSNGSRMGAEHLLIESDDPTWRSGATRELTLRVTPKTAGNLPVRVRGWICADGYSDCARAPAYGTDDQQGYNAAVRSVLVVAAPTPEPAPPAETGGRNGRIAFSSDRDGNWEIYAMNADGSGATRLTNNSASDRAPSWSPDGRRVAFNSNRDGNNEIYAMNADGSGATRLTNNSADDWGPSWSPDGRRIAFSSNRNGNYEIYAMNADGSGVARLTNRPNDEYRPRWSPDGGKITFYSYHGDNNREIYAMDADGSDVVRLTNNSAHDLLMSWSPDGRRVVFLSNRAGNYEIYTMNPDGSGVVRLTNNSANEWYPSWSPDGRRIAFSSNRSGNWEIYAMNSDGSGVARLAANSGRDWDPSWGAGVPDAAPAPDAGDDHGDDRASATAMNAGSAVSGDIETSRDHDFFSFRAQSGAEYTIETRVRSELDTVIELHSGQGASLAQDDDGGPGYGSKIVWTAPSSGTYYVNVYGYGGASVGGYDLSLSERVPEAAPAPGSETHLGELIVCDSFAARRNEIQCVYNHPDQRKPNRHRIFRIQNFQDAEWGGSGDAPVTEAHLAQWLLEGQDKLDELGMVYNPTLEVNIKDLGDVQGQVGNNDSIDLNSQPRYDSIAEMRATAVHELFHHSQRNGSNQILNAFGGNPRLWLVEGSAQWFVDEVYDRQDWYQETGLGSKMREAQLEGGLVNTDDAQDAYARATFFKLIDNACPRAQERHVVASVFQRFLAPAISSGLSDLENALAFHNCDFGGHLGENKESSLEAAMAYYNYATMLYESVVSNGSGGTESMGTGGKISLLDSDETDCRHWVENRTQVKEEGLCFARPQTYLGAAPTRASLKPTSAHSFLMPAQTLSAGKVAKLTVTATHPTTVSIVGDTTGGEADVSPNGRNTIGPDRDPHYWFVSGSSGRGTSGGSFTYGTPGQALPELLVTLVTPGRGLFTNQVTVKLEIVDETDDHGDNRSSATAMNVGSAVVGNIETAGDEDFFSFQAQSGAEYTIETSVRTGMDTVIELHSGQGAQLARNDDGGAGYGYGSKIVWTAPSSGAYYVKVFGYRGTSVGGYDLSVSERAPSVAENDRIVSEPASISAGTGHACALRENGRAECWGWNRYGQASPPTGTIFSRIAFAAVSAGGRHSCGLRENGTAECWGVNRYGQSSPPDDGIFTAISAGAFHTCALREDGTAICWGWDEEGQASPPSNDERFVAISAGGYHTCALREDGTAECWGRNDRGPWGRGNVGQASPPSDERFIAISAGIYHTCALREDGSARCWGERGQASPPSNGETFATISAGGYHTCALREDGTAECWGADSGYYNHGQSSPPSDGERFVAISAGLYHTCALRPDGTAACWGSGENGRSSPPDETFATGARR